MALTVDKLINDDRFNGDNVLQFLLYLPIGLILLVVRTLLGLLLWVASILLPNKWAIRQVLSTLACWTFGVYVKVKGERDPRCSVMVANYVSCLDSLAASHVLGTISLRKWKVPPFFASTLGIRNAAQFARKQHFAECPSKPVLLQPEGGPTNGRGILKFTDWPFQMGNRVQPVAISVERVFTAVTVHRPSDSRVSFPWSDALWFLCSPVTVYTLHLLPPVDRMEDDDVSFAHRCRETIAAARGIETCEYKWEQLVACSGRLPQQHQQQQPNHSQQQNNSQQAEMMRRAQLVKEVLPRVPIVDIMRDLALTRSVDVTITNFLEGAAPYSPEPEPEPEPRASAPGPSTSTARSLPVSVSGTFPRSARERQLGFEARKAEMVAEARRRYIDKHGLHLATC